MCCSGTSTCVHCNPPKPPEQVRKSEQQFVTYKVPVAMLKKFLEDMEPGTSLEGFTLNESYILDSKVVTFSLEKEDSKLI